MIVNRDRSIFDKADFVQGDSAAKIPIRRVYGRTPVGNNIAQTQKPNTESEAAPNVAAQQNNVHDNIEDIITIPELYSTYLPYSRESSILQNIPDIQDKYINPILDEDISERFTVDNLSRLKPYIVQMVKDIIKHNVLIFSDISNLSNNIKGNTGNIINELAADAIREMVKDATIKITKDIHVQRNLVYVYQPFQKKDFSNIDITINTSELIHQINSILSYETDRDKMDYASYEQNNHDMNLIRNKLLIMAMTITESYMEEWNNIVSQSE